MLPLCCTSAVHSLIQHFLGWTQDVFTGYRNACLFSWLFFFFFHYFLFIIPFLCWWDAGRGSWGAMHQHPCSLPGNLLVPAHRSVASQPQLLFILLENVTLWLRAGCYGNDCSTQLVPASCPHAKARRCCSLCLQGISVGHICALGWPVPASPQCPQLR